MVRPARDVEEDGVPRRVSVRVAIRAGLACTLLAALFLMHGLSPAEGCPGGQSMSVSGAHSDSTLATHADSTLANGPAAATMSDTAARHFAMMGNAASAGVGLGQVCVSRPPHLAAVGPVALTLLVAIIGLAAWADWPYLLGSYARRRRRAPPSGRTLLHILCLSRT
jgi:hypothetical protein